MIEDLYPLRLIERDAGFAFLLGFSYSIIGVGLAVLLFPQDPAMVAVALIALMAYPTIRGLMGQEEMIEARREDRSVRSFFSDHRQVFKTYLLFFLGSALVFSLFALMLPSLATGKIFQNQLDIHAGGATFSAPLFWDLLANNAAVMAVIVLTSFFIGDGGIFLLVWNASVWGTVFGFLAKNAAAVLGRHPFALFGIIVLTVIWHVVLEVLAYIAAATTGGVISKGLLTERVGSTRYRHVVTNTIISLVVAALIIIAAVALETWVLGTADAYRAIIAAAHAA